MTTIVNGQIRDYKKGFVVFNNGDTINGFVRDDSPEFNCTKVIVKEESGKKRKYTSKDIRFFKRDNESFIKVVVDTINNKAVERLVMIINDGRYKLLRYEYGLPSGGMSSMDSGIFPVTEYFVIIASDLMIQLHKGNYPQILNKYYQDRMINSKKYRFDNIENDFIELNK